MLTDRQRAILDLERGWFKHAGRKEAVVRETFDCSLARYSMELNALLDDPAAWAEDAQLVKRLRGLREERKRLRSAR